MNKAEIIELLEEVKDPEVPVLSLRELGVLRDVEVLSDGVVRVTITPTYSGCPALDVMKEDIIKLLSSHGIIRTELLVELSPPWGTDSMTEEAKEKLRAYGIAAPRQTQLVNLPGKSLQVACPRCGSLETKEISRFGSTACKAMYSCAACKEPFEYFKEF